jgi:hypothetical protein
MIETILGSENAERVLIYILVRGKGYASEIADFFGVDLSPIQKQLLKFEAGGVFISTLAGRTRIFQFNPSYAFLSELKELLNKAFQFYPPGEVEQLKMNRRRPRRTGKPL